mmetsp:Transcript_17992/g.39285  ORF Transcript_17992/g.39285 Transcript_17992/m.39285 type:complete len:319 (-) Transcript_17992:195-1151(-)
MVVQTNHSLGVCLHPGDDVGVDEVPEEHLPRLGAAEHAAVRAGEGAVELGAGVGVARVRRQLLPGPAVQQPQPRVQAPGEEAVAVVGEADGGDRVVQVVRHDPPAPHVERAHRAVHAARHDGVPRHLHGGDAVLEALHGLDGLHGVGAAVPYLHRLVVAGGDDERVVRGEHHRVHRVVVPVHPPDGAPRAHVPVEHLLVAATRRQPVVVLRARHIPDLLPVAGVRLDAQLAIWNPQPNGTVLSTSQTILTSSVILYDKHRPFMSSEHCYLLVRQSLHGLLDRTLHRRPRRALASLYHSRSCRSIFQDTSYIAALSRRS